MIARIAATLLLALSAALSIQVRDASAETAIFAGGCFWCVESDFDHVSGVTSTTSGYIGGSSANPTYKTYVAGGHREAVRVIFNPSRISYEKLLDVFWHSVDPTDGGGQFCDRGHAYTTAIYAVGGKQRAEAGKSKRQAVAELGKHIVTPVIGAPKFWPAEAYHQNYYRKNPVRYKYYRYSCGRDKRVRQVWGAAARRGIGG